MRTRRATEKDINRIGELLDQVDMVHHVGRPDLFNIGRKYTARQLKELLLDDTRPVFVAEDEENRVLGHAFCVFQQHEAPSSRPSDESQEDPASHEKI